MPTALLVDLLPAHLGLQRTNRSATAGHEIAKKPNANLSIAAYFGSKVSVLTALALIQCSTKLVFVYFGGGLRGSPLVLFAILLVSALTGIGIGLLLSAIAKTTEVAIAMLPIVLLGMVIVGGVMSKVHEMHAATQSLAAINPARWCFQAMIVLESKERPREPTLGLPPIMQPRRRQVIDNEPGPDMAEGFFPNRTHRSRVGTSIAILILLTALYLGGAPLVLRLRDLRAMATQTES